MLDEKAWRNGGGGGRAYPVRVPTLNHSGSFLYKKKVMAVASHRNDCDRTFACQAGQAAGLGSRWFQLWDVERPVVICEFRVITSFHCKRQAVVYFKQ